MLPWGRRTSVIAIVVLVTLGSVAPGVAVASAGETRAVDDSTADRTVASAMAQWAVATRHASLPQEAAAEIEWRARVVPGAPASDGRAAAVDPVTGCRVIDSRGRYELTADVTNSTDSTCIDVRSSDVIIDGNGHTIDGVGAAGTVGVFANGTNGTLDNVSVRDLVVTDWADGVRFEDAADGRVERVVAERNGDGFDLVGSPGTAVSDVTVADSDAAGFRLDSSPGNRFTNVSVTDSGSQGFVFSGSGENRLSDVSAAGSGGSGFSFEVGSGGNTLTDVSAGDSGGSGFSFSSASGGNSLENATVEDSDGAGFSFLYATGGNTLTNVTVVDSGGDGVFVGLRGSGDNVFRDVTVRNSSRHGFSFNAGNTTFENVTARDNGLGGFEIFDAGNHTLTNVSAVDNGGIGFEFRNLVSDNRFTNVSARGNDDEGFLLADADRTALVGVSATGNGAGVVVSGSTAVEIDGGTVENNTADGVRLEGAPHTTIRGARLLDNGRDGLLAANGSDRTLVTGVTARGNARCGLSVVASKGVRVVDSGTEANGDSGLGVGITQSGRTATSRDVVLENTTALDNGEHGVELGGSAVGVTVGTTNASDNAVDGIHVGGADGVTMRDTTTLGNGRWALFAAGTSEVYSVDDLAIDGGGVSFTARSVAVRGVSAPSTAPPSGHAGVGIYVNATPTGPNPFFDVSVSYDQAAADAAGVNESTLRLWEFDGSTWTAVTGSTVDEAANTVSANVTGFSVFAPVGADGSEPEPTPTPAAAAAATGGSGGDGGPNEPPVAAFDVSTDAPEVDAAVRFDAADSSDPDGVIVSYEWDFDGDGDTDATGASAEVTHAYEAGGTFEASLTVVDSFGATNTTTRSVDVATGPTPTVTTTPTATTTPTETETPTPTATATDTVTPTGMGDSSRTPATTPFGSSFPWWLPGGLIVAGVALYVARRWRDGRR